MPKQPEAFVGPHQNQPVLAYGADLSEAQAVMIMTHGRGDSARNFLSIAVEMGREDVAYLAPQAANSTWYPQRFLAPLEANEPYLSSALVLLNDTVQSVVEQGVPAEKIILLGFSQGACLSLEYVARNAQRFGGVIAFSGGVIGPEGTPRDYAGDLAGTPVFLGCSDIDPHIPLERVQESTNIMTKLSGKVDERIYPNMGHMLNRDEIEVAQAMLAQVAG